MSWILLVGFVLVLGLALLLGAARRVELRSMRSMVDERDRVVELGASEAQLMHPIVDLSRCLGCATCVVACPEQDVLGIVHGQARVINGSHCQGISACARECPVGAIVVTLAGAAERRDIPVLDNTLEATGSPGLFLAGEVTARALIKTALEQGAAVATEVARRKALEHTASTPRGQLDLCIIGAGPAGLACALEAKRTGLSYVVLEQEQAIGGTVAKYPRRKLVLTQPVELPLYGRLKRTTYEKEELIELWGEIAREQDLAIVCGQVFRSLERGAEEQFVITTESGSHEARNVCLALGRRGIPRRLGIPGEDLPKVAHSLVDAGSHEHSRILVVGGGDTAVEAALALAGQPGNTVTLSYRKSSFFRIKRRNEQRLEQLLGSQNAVPEADAAESTGVGSLARLLGSPHATTRSAASPLSPTASNVALAAPRLQVFFDSEVVAVGPDSVELSIREGDGTRSLSLPNDEVFVMIGGTPPIELLERSGVSFDPAQRPSPRPVEERGTGVLRALAIGFAVSMVALVWALWHGDYYLLESIDRPTHDKHALLRPGLGLGLGFGFAGAGLILVNLLYLVRRSARFKFEWGSLAGWMTSHVATGILAFLCALLHGAMAPKDTPGGHALWALAVLMLTGAIGRYLYAYVPRAANGRELALEEVRERLRHLSDYWDADLQEFAQHVRAEVASLAANRQWRGSFAGRVLALVGVRMDLRRVLRRLKSEGQARGVEPQELRRTLEIARRAHGAALAAAHLEDLRAVLNTWRYLHRWVAALMVVLVVLHIFYALSYGSIIATGGLR